MSRSGKLNKQVQRNNSLLYKYPTLLLLYPIQYSTCDSIDLLNHNYYSRPFGEVILFIGKTTFYIIS